MVKNLPANAGDGSLDVEDPLEKNKWQPTLDSCLGNFMDRGTWQATVHGVKKQ